MASRLLLVSTGLALLSALVVCEVGVAGGAPQNDEQPFLLALPGQTVVVNYTPGALDRAVHLQRRLELLGNDFVRWSGAEARLRVFVLSREEWGIFGLHLPYGLPGRIKGSTLAVPSYGDAGTVALWTEIRGVAPPPLPGIPMKGTAQEASSLALSDLLVEVEAARVLLSIAEIRGEVNWLHQLLAHVQARAAFEAYEAARLPEITAVFESLGDGVAAPLALSRYAPGLELQTLLWFESRFQDGARELMDTDRKNAAKAMLKLAVKNGGVLTERTFFEHYPTMRGWLERTFAPEAPASG